MSEEEKKKESVGGVWIKKKGNGETFLSMEIGGEKLRLICGELL